MNSRVQNLLIILTLVSMESSHLVIFSTSDKFITKFNVLRCISLSETLFWTGVEYVIDKLRVAGDMKNKH